MTTEEIFELIDQAAVEEGPDAREAAEQAKRAVQELCLDAAVIDEMYRDDEDEGELYYTPDL